MKKAIFLISLICFTSVLYAQKDYNVVFDITSKDTIDQKNVIRWVNAISKEYPDAKLDVVLYGKSLDMIVKDRSVVAEGVQSLAANENVSIKVCAIAMKNNQVEAAQLLPGVVIVPDGIYEIVTRQRQGWGYIKVSK